MAENVPSTAAERIEAGLPAVEIADPPSDVVEDVDEWADPPAADTPPADPPAADPPAAEVPPAETAVDYQGLVETMDREMAANPVNLLTNLAKSANMTPEQVLQLARSLTPTPDDKPLPDNYEPQGLLEPELVKRDRMDWIFKGEEVVDKRIADATGKMAPFIDGANQEIAIQRAVTDGLIEALGMNIQPDRKAISERVAKGESFADAVQHVMGATIKAEVAKAKQAVVERPSTPGSSGNDLMERRPGMPMTSYLNAVKNGVKI